MVLIQTINATQRNERTGTMAIYTFELNRYAIVDTRSVHEDTNYVTAALSVNGQPIGSPQTRFMGDQNNGTFPVGFKWAGVEVPEGGTVVLLYQILNSGHGNHADVERALTAVAETQLGSEDPVDWRVAILKWLAANSIKIVFANCDGPIAPPEGRKIVWSSAELKGVAPGTTLEESVHEHGNNSPPGCGKNSHYVVYFSTTA
jgi:hypothetical protein